MTPSATAKARLQAIHNHLSLQPCFHPYAIQNHTATGPTDLARERANVSFPMADMTEMILRGKENVVAQSLAYQMIQRDPELRWEKGHNYDLTRDQDREQTLRQVIRVIQLRNSTVDSRLNQAVVHAMAHYSEAFWMMFVHDTLFKQTFEFFATPQQKDKWMRDIECWKVFGCFAMTELGHSSNLPGLETTSTFDRTSDEFVIHSPNLTSTKWWIGMSGRTATHCVVVCRTLVDEKDYGINWFIVPLRNLQTGHLLPGVICGDVGQKHSRQGLDTGYIQFSQVRIPRENMLQRYATFTPYGEFKPLSSNQAVYYAPLISERFATLRYDLVTLSKALTVAVRYSAVRRQGSRDEQILDYQIQQTRLMPGVAFIYVLNIVDRQVSEKWNQVKKLAQTDHQEFLNELPDQHGIAASFKAIMSWYVTEVLENCRRACGGHGYSAYNAIPSLIGDFGVITTGGGDNVVLMQQSARYLISSLRKVYMGQKVEGSVEYLNDYVRVSLMNKTCFQDSRDLLNLDFVIDILTRGCIKKAMELQNILQKAGQEFDQVWNRHQTELVRMADLHTWRHFLTVFQQGIEHEKSTKPTTIYPILQQMGQLFSTFLLCRHLDFFLQEEYLNGSHAKLIQQLFLDQCQELRTQAVGLMDAWSIPDFILRAPIGNFNGDIYPAYFQTVNAAQQSFEPTKYWQKYVAPMVNPSSLSSSSSSSSSGSVAQVKVASTRFVSEPSQDYSPYFNHHQAHA